MYRQKVFLFAAIVLTMASTANADLILTLNGVDAAKEPLEIKGKNNLVITVAGQTQVNANDYSVTASGGGLEICTGDYLFTFEGELGVVSLIASEDMVVDGISVVAGGTIYELVLFYIPETDEVIVFGINLESLIYTPPPPQPKQQVSAPQTTSSAAGGPGVPLAGGAGDCNEVLDPNFYPNLNADQLVNFKDFAILAANWLESGDELDGDLDKSETVDIDDLAILTYYWLASACGPSPEEIFESFKSALLADDLNTALGCFTEISAENYEPLLEQLRPYFTQMVSDMGALIFISGDDNTETYDLLREENGNTYGYPVLFVRNEMGQWKISDF